VRGCTSDQLCTVLRCSVLSRVPRSAGNQVGHDLNHRRGARLLANALLDPRNTHFVLLSETCIPFYDFDFTFKYITQSPTSFLENTAPLNWWSQTMLPLVPEDKLRKGSAWFAIQRRHAALIVADQEFYAQFDKGWGFGHGFDEHYYQTLLTHLDPGGLANRSVMYAAFKQWKVHPIVYSFEDISPPFLASMSRT